MTLQEAFLHRQHSFGDIMPQFHRRIPNVAEIYFVPEREQPPFRGPLTAQL
jgi:hypothetical protein